MFLFGVIMLIVLGAIFIKPIKLILKLALNSAIGIFMLLMINWLGAGAGLSVGINWLGALICGVLGIPGVILVLMLKWLGFG